jgi:type IV secretory pathway VirJ component
VGAVVAVVAATLMVSPLLAATPPASSTAAAPLRVAAGRLGEVIVRRPPVAVRDVALLIDGDDRREAEALQTQLLATGAVVVSIEARRYLQALAATRADCRFLGADLESLSHLVQKRLALDEYRVPLLVGTGVGAALAYAVLAQSPQGTYAGMLTPGFCPTLDVPPPLCRAYLLDYATAAAPATVSPTRAPSTAIAAGTAAGGVVLRAAPGNRTPWVATAGTRCAAESSALIGATGSASLAADSRESTLLAALGTARSGRESRSAPAGGIPAASPVADLPLVELPAAAVPAPGFADTFVVLLTGDGGWAGLDQDVAAAFAARGMPVVALNSLKYWWTERPPDIAAADLARVVAHYGAEWRRSRVLLLGYSFGADAAPFLYTRLPADVRAQVRSVNLIGLGDAADFQFHVTDWLPGAGGAHPTVPEIARMGDVRILCLYGSEERDSACPRLEGTNVRSESVAGGHHLDGNADGLVARMLAHARP